MKYNNGDQIKVFLKNETYEGLYISSEDKHITIKLDNGYNISLNQKNIIKTELIKKYRKKKEKETKYFKKDKLKNISILNFGGTVASKVDYSTGGVNAKFTSNELYNLFPEIKNYANINFRLIQQVMSENIRFGHYNELANEIKKEYDKGVDGIIITHGTDTMHYTSSALSFILQNINIPVILVGSQRSSDRGSSDATYNLLSATYFISKTDYSGVSICMHNNSDDDECIIIPGTKVRKLHSSRRDAFRPINTKPYAYVNYMKNEIKITKKFPQKNGDKKLEIKPIKENLKIAILKFHPNFYSKQLNSYKNFDALIIEGFGLGQISIEKTDKISSENKKIYNKIKKMSKNTILVMTSQTIYGRVCMNVYSQGRKAMELGFIGNNLDITTETAFIKLAWLLSNYSKEDAKKLFMKNLRDEISLRIEQNEFLK